jgi:hypothetical protein
MDEELLNSFTMLYRIKEKMIKALAFAMAISRDIIKNFHITSATYTPYIDILKNLASALKTKSF